MLRFDYDHVDGELIRYVRGSVRQVSSDGTVSYEEVLIGLEKQVMHIQPNVDTDELEVSLADRCTMEARLSTFTDVPELLECVGRALGWCWEARNYRGYWDMFCFSASGINPDFCLVGMASTIELKRVTRIIAMK